MQLHDWPKHPNKSDFECCLPAAKHSSSLKHPPVVLGPGLHYFLIIYHYWKITIFKGRSSFTGALSLASMLNYQEVIIDQWYGLVICNPNIPQILLRDPQNCWLIDAYSDWEHPKILRIKIDDLWCTTIVRNLHIATKELASLAASPYSSYSPCLAPLVDSAEGFTQRVVLFGPRTVPSDTICRMQLPSGNRTELMNANCLQKV